MSSSRTGHTEKLVACRSTGGGGVRGIPGPLTFRMMERVVSSMNSTRTWVTPPREPIVRAHQHGAGSKGPVRGPERTGSAEDAGDLDELDGSLGGIHFCD